MADNSSIPVASGNETFANNEIAGVKFPRVKLTWGVAGVAVDASATNPIPIVGSVTGSTVNASQDGTWDINSITTLPAVTVNGISTTAADRGAGATTAQTTRVVIVNEQVEGGQYYDVPADTATATLLGAGAVTDFLNSIIVFPETTSPGQITLKDGDFSAIVIFQGGTGSVSNLIPFSIPFGHGLKSSTTPGFRVTVGANVHIRVTGKFA